MKTATTAMFGLQDAALAVVTVEEPEVLDDVVDELVEELLDEDEEVALFEVTVVELELVDEVDPFATAELEAPSVAAASTKHNFL